MITTSPLRKKYTLEEFWDLPEPENGYKLELIDGVLYMTPPPGAPHNFAAVHLNRMLSLHLASTNDPGILFVPRAALWTSPATYLEPDLFYISASTAAQIDLTKPNRADLVVEIVSPSTAVYDRNTKADTYAVLGVKELWIADPAKQTVEVLFLDPSSQCYETTGFYGPGDSLKSPLFPTFSPAVRDIFKFPLPQG